MTYRNCLHAAASAALILAAGQAQAALASDDPFAGFAPLDRAELGEMRGGMVIGGIPVDFAVVIRTTVAGAIEQMGLQTTLTVNESGGIAGAQTASIGGGSGSATLPASADGLTTTLTDGATTIMHQVLKDQMTALVSNTTDGVVLNTSTEVNVTMPGFQQMAQTYYTQRHVSNINRDAVLVGLGRF